METNSRRTYAPAKRPGTEPGTGSALPAELEPLFWDVEFAETRWPEHDDFVVKRILDQGGLNAIRWVRATVGDERLVRWLGARKGAGIDRRRLRFFEAILDIPHRRVNAWLRRPERQVWDNRCITKP
ncbi:MAG: hypothetical protein NT029_07950 [Armatimonadetes bacterium]|nr:hypothetical protein [Armatimonadota bacterium]